MTNITQKAKKTNPAVAERPILPLQGYIMSIKSNKERMKLRAELKEAAEIGSDQQLYRFCYGEYNPSKGQKVLMTEVIRRHSGDKSITAESLFPVEFYKNE